MANESEVGGTPTETSTTGESTKVDETKTGEETSTGGQQTEVVVETPEAKRSRLKRELDRHEKKYGFSEDRESSTKAKKTKTDELDYGQLAFYNSKSDSLKIESDEDIEFLKEQMEGTGKSQKDILASNWFKAEFKERKDAKAVAKATPGSTRTATENSSTKVDYWIAKGELPADKELRQQVVEKKYELAKAGKLPK